MFFLALFNFFKQLSFIAQNPSTMSSSHVEQNVQTGREESSKLAFQLLGAPPQHLGKDDPHGRSAEEILESAEKWCIENDGEPAPGCPQKGPCLKPDEHMVQYVDNLTGTTLGTADHKRDRIMDEFMGFCHSFISKGSDE
jgi:hypothetical protein